MAIKQLLLLLLISGSVMAQQTSQQNIKEFNALTKVEDEERFYNDMIAKSLEDPAKPNQYNAYRAQLAVDWLIGGDVDKYKFYKNTRPKFTAIQLFDLSNLLELWVDDGKNIAIVEQISKQILAELVQKMHNDTFDREAVLMEVNAMANSKLGKSDLAMKNIRRASLHKTPFRNIPYFRNSKANYLTRYATILSSAGQDQRALDTLSKAVRNAISTPKTIAILRDIYAKVHGDTDKADKYIASLQAEAYQKVYKEVEKTWMAKPKQAPDLAMSDMDGKEVKLSDYKGKIVMIDFWSTACKPCVAAFPAFERAIELYKDEPFQLLVINEGEDVETAKPYMDKKGYKLNVLFDKNELVFTKLEALGTPQKFIIDKNGIIHLTGIGYSGSDDKEFYKIKAMVELTKARSSVL